MKLLKLFYTFDTFRIFQHLISNDIICFNEILSLFSICILVCDTNDANKINEMNWFKYQSIN